MLDSLNVLTSDEFEALYDLVGSTSGLYRSLARSSAIAEVRRALGGGQLDDSDLRSFIASLLETWESGRLFPHDIALAAIAVAVEERFTDFADEYLHDLARLSAAEMPKSIKIARLILAKRSEASRDISRRFLVSARALPNVGWRCQEQTDREDVAQTSQRFCIAETVCQN